MNYSGDYLSKQGKVFPEITTSLNKNLGIIVVIPCYNEPDFINTLNSLYNCHKPDCAVEIIVVINSSKADNIDIKENNIKLKNEINVWKKKHKDLDVHVITKSDIPSEVAGVGYARKLGMDEAVFRFNKLNNPDGVIMSLDADCLCDKDYFIEIEKNFYENKSANLCILNFAHPLSGNEYSNEIYNAITKYELYLRYYKHALKYTGFPHSYYTIGSCLGVKSGIYAKQGGMVTKQAGEDFYFIQKLLPLNGIIEISKELVFPSPRISRRVPFGTGPAVNEIISNKNTYKTFSFKTFTELKKIFDNLNYIYDTRKFDEFVNRNLNYGLDNYLYMINFTQLVNEIKNNTSNYKSFKKRFFLKFNALKILQYLNFAHKEYLKLVEINESVNDLLIALNLYDEKMVSSYDKLIALREFDKIG
ncbi:MAG: hypothetical protein Kow0068_04130 [Marinilabiliales bacterium]